MAGVGVFSFISAEAVFAKCFSASRSAHYSFSFISSSSVIRECLDKSILLGPLENPLLPQPFCAPQDISEDSQSLVEACLCESDLCNGVLVQDQSHTETINNQAVTVTDEEVVSYQDDVGFVCLYIVVRLLIKII